MVNKKITLPKWLEERHSKLWAKYQDSSFRMEDASEYLKEVSGVEKDEVNVVLSELRKAGWLTVNLDPEDNRKRIYNLKSKEQIIKEEFTLKEGRLTRSDIITILKKAADLIRTRVDYKFILVLLFLKEISDKWDIEYQRALNEAIEDGLSEEDAAIEASEPSFHDFDLPEEYKWDNLRKDVENLPENFSNALKTIADRNTQLKGVIDSFDFVEFTQSRENAEILRQLVELFSEKKLHNVDPDILGDAYEWILSYFAPQKAKEGEVYTPREVIKLLVEILDPKPGESVYDPASASNGMLIISHNYVKDHYGKNEADKLFLYGQEVNQKTLALGTMNLYIHDIKNAHVVQGDTLLYPKFKEENGIKQFDVVIANPPWNLDGFPEDTLKKGDFWKQRYNYGFVTKRSADWAWIQHMIASTKEDVGRLGIIIDNGALFRSGKEKNIRAGIVKDDLIDCVILLPEKLFYNTGAPGAILVLNKNKPEDRKGKVLFINASEEFEQHPEVRKLNILTDENLDHLVDIYRNFENADGFAKIISLDEIRENEYNLNVPLYAFSQEEIEKIDVAEEWKELKELESKLGEIEEQVESHLNELGSYNEFKETKIGKIPANWALKSLIETGELEDGDWILKENYTEEGVRLLQVGDIGYGTFANKSNRHISPKRAQELNCTLVDADNEILISRMPDPVGRACLAPNLGKPYIVAVDVSIFRPDESIISKEFALQLFNSEPHLNNVTKYLAGATRARISRTNLEKIKIPLPPLQEQQKIAEILSYIDKEIEFENKRKERLERIKRGLMNDFLTGKKRIKLDI